ncbi:MAG: hypothetical protein ABL309_00205 [Phycisphaerales bacterium]
MVRRRTVASLGVVLIAGVVCSANAGEPCVAQWVDHFGPENGLSGDAYCLEVFDDGTGPAVYVGGAFFNAAGVRVDRIAKWNGSGWELLSGPSGNGVLSGTVNAMCVYDDGAGPALFVGGTFFSAGGLPANKIAKWDGVQWSTLTGPFGTGIPSVSVDALEVFDDGSGPKLYVGGSFSIAGGVAASDLATWDGSEWAPILSDEGNGISGSVNSFEVYDDGTGPALFVGGLFDLADNTPAGSIAKWDGENWSLLEGPSGTGVSQRVFAMQVYDEGDGPVLFVGGQFFEAGGLECTKLARWDGTQWSQVLAPGGEGLPGTIGVLGMTTFDDGTGEKLVACGNFLFGGDVEVNRVASWDGVNWSAFEGPEGIGLGVTYDVLAFETEEGPALFAAGEFGFAGGIPSSRIAQWQACDPEPGPCDADATGDGSIDLADLNLVLANFGQATADGDTNGDGTVDLADLNAVLGAFGTLCE